MKTNFLHIVKLNCKRPLKLVFCTLFASVLLASCESFINIDPPITEIVNESVFANDIVAEAAINGIYSEMMNSSGFASGGQTGISLLCGLSADEFVNLTPSDQRIEFYTNSLQQTNTDLLNSTWELGYRYIFYSNSVLEGLQKSDGVTQAKKNQLEGEAKFLRAFCYFYLSSLFGDVPLITSTDYEVNRVASRVGQNSVFQQVIKDLQEARNLLSEDYLVSEGERTRPNKAVTTAFLARVFLFNKDWADAENMATEIINNSGTYSLVDLEEVFLANSLEAIWQLRPVDPNLNTNDARIYNSPSFITLSDELLNAFEAEDNRADSWIGSIVNPATGNIQYHPFKYKVSASGQPLTEYSMVLRLSEQFLIRAEARAQQENILGAQEDLNMIRSRAGLPDTPANDMAALLLAIEQERRVELFSEWGHRWLDLKRTDRANDILSAIDYKDWQSEDTLYPIPTREIENNPNLLPQNPGY